MRQELIGLKWENVNWKLGKLQVKRHARHFKGDSYTFTELKSESGVRTIELGKRALELLEEHRQEQQL